MDTQRNYPRFVIFLYWYTLIGLLILSFFFSKTDVVLWVNSNHSNFLRLASFLLLAMALLVGYSRIYLLQHFLLDVTAGAFIGALTAFFIADLFNRNDFPNWMKSRLAVGIINGKFSLQAK